MKISKQIAVKYEKEYYTAVSKISIDGYKIAVPHI